MKIRHMFAIFFFALLSLLPHSFSAEDGELDQMVEKGEILVKQGSYEAGISVLETVWERDPMNGKAFTALLSAYDAASKKMVSQGRFVQARKYFSKMEDLLKKVDTIPLRDMTGGDRTAESRIKREIADAKAYMSDNQSPKDKEAVDLVMLNSGRDMYNKAVEHFNKRDYQMAEDLLRESIKLDSSNPFAYELLGDVANLNQRLDEAESYYKKAFELNPTPGIREKYEKIIREKKVDEGQQQYSDEHFIIRYRRSENLGGSEIREYLREAYRVVSQDLGFYPQYQIPVILMNRAEYQQVIGTAPHWSAGLYDGKIRIPIYQGAQDRQNLKRLIYHELTHAFLFVLSEGTCPVWLQEGMGQYEENKIRPINTYILGDAVRNKKLFSRDEFLTTSRVSMSETKAHLYYVQCYSFTSYLISKYRIFGIKELLVAMSKKTQFSDAFETAFKAPFDVAWDDWRSELSRRYKGK